MTDRASWLWDPDIGGIRRAAALHQTVVTSHTTDPAARCEKLRRARIAANLTQKALAALIGGRESGISMVERGHRRISQERADRWLAACDRPETAGRGQ